MFLPWGGLAVSQCRCTFNLTDIACHLRTKVCAEALKYIQHFPVFYCFSTCIMCILFKLSSLRKTVEI